MSAIASLHQPRSARTRCASSTRDGGSYFAADDVTAAFYTTYGCRRWVDEAVEYCIHYQAMRTELGGGRFAANPRSLRPRHPCQCTKGSGATWPGRSDGAEAVTPGSPLCARSVELVAAGSVAWMGGSVELVIFDCDGVLVDSERLAVRIEARLISDLGWPVTEQDVLQRFVGRSDAYMLGEIERALGRPVPDWGYRYREHLHAAFEAELTAIDGIHGALEALRCSTCVASSGTHEKMRLTLGLTGLLDHFRGRVYSVTEVSRGKPAPDLFLHAAERSGVPPGRCVVVEDSRSGVEAARAAGMRSLGYAGGLTPPEWLEGADTVVFDHMTQLPGLVQSL